MANRIELVGENIVVRTFMISDARDLQRNINDKAIVRYTVSIPHPYSINDALEYIRKTSRKNKKKTGDSFGIALKETGHIIGGIGFHRVDLDNRNAELGYWLGKKYWGHKITPEAVGLMLKFGFEELGLHRIYAKVFNENFASRRVLEKSGFLLEEF